ncbi:Transposase [Shigella dysenteriae 1617]|uniref:Transposase n=1 Tax=Shigella dysenteriae 1617 TaxID=754093 RepID=A0A0A7A2K1_SHIDY|nr:Transposase [Shigella dysenteriae 1617]
MATLRGFRMGRWLAGRLMKELGLVSCQQPAHRYKRGGHEHVTIPNHLGRQFAVTEPNQVWCGDVTYIWTGKRWAYLGQFLLTTSQENQWAGPCGLRELQRGSPRHNGLYRWILQRTKTARI